MPLTCFARGRSLRLLIALSALFVIHAAMAAERSIDRATLPRLSALEVGASVQMDAFPVGPTVDAAVRFQRMQIYSTDAHIYLIGADGKAAAIVTQTQIVLQVRKPEADA